MDENNDNNLQRILGQLLSDVGSEKSRLDRLETAFYNRLTEVQSSYKQDMLELTKKVDRYQEKIEECMNKQGQQLVALLESSQKAEGQREASLKYQNSVRWFVGILFTTLGAMLGVALHYYLLKVTKIW